MTMTEDVAVAENKPQEPSPKEATANPIAELNSNEAVALSNSLTPASTNSSSSRASSISPSPPVANGSHQEQPQEIKEDVTTNNTITEVAHPPVSLPEKTPEVTNERPPSRESLSGVPSAAAISEAAITSLNGKLSPTTAPSVLVNNSSTGELLEKSNDDKEKNLTAITKSSDERQETPTGASHCSPATQLSEHIDASGKHTCPVCYQACSDHESVISYSFY